MEPRNIKNVLERAVDRNPDKVYLLYGNQQITYGQMSNFINQTANMFLDLGIRKGDRVALMLPNCPEFIYLWFGLVKIGASMVPVNTFFRERETAYILQHSEARAMVATPDYWPIVQKAMETGNIQLGRRLCVGGSWGDTLPYEKIRTQFDSEFTGIDLKFDDEAAILYTSGTTGNPKGCLESHGYYLVAGNRYSSHLSLTANDRVITPLPLFHMNPQILSTMGTLFVGGSLALVDRFHSRSWWQEVRAKEATHFHYLGVMPAVLMGTPEQADDGEHPHWIGIGAGVPKTIHRPFEERFNVTLLEVFGMTETGLNFCCLPQPERNVGTACFCKPFMEYEAKVVDDNDNEVPFETIGELVLRGSDPANRQRGFMFGYYKDPQATAKAWQNGWFHTGDVVRRDTEGRYYFVDRKKDIVRRSGENISASEVEGTIHLHPAVMDVAVIPVSDPIREQEVKAYIVLKEGYSQQSMPVQELIRWAEEHLAYFKVPRYWEFCESLPVTQTGKILKQMLKLSKEDLTVGSFDRQRCQWIS
ncbi:putative crotonobetaine/carnitine-CoA ligase [Peptococcaceae bacterium CEB3]|nr:putative crotonobetaine/carnitine-CoA ligase [Peptococcaceae bacterium CEB3]